MTATKTDPADYAYWRTELASPMSLSRDDPPTPPCGYWRAVGADTKADYPVAIYRVNGTVMFFVGPDHRKAAPWDSEPGYQFRAGRWLNAVAVPVEDWTKATATGNWPDGKPINSTIEHVSMRNALPETGDAFTDLTRQFEAEAETARAIMKKGVQTQADADQAAAFAKRIAEIKGRADDAFAIEKRPILESAKACDDKWRAVRQGAADMVAELKAAINAVLARIRREEEDRRRAAAAEAERQRREAEELARRAAESDQKSAAERQRLMDDARAKDEAAARAAREAERPVEISAGRMGAKISQRKVIDAEITDYPAALAHFSEAEAIKEAVQKLATAAVRAGMTVPGVRRVETLKAV